METQGVVQVVGMDLEVMAEALAVGQVEPTEG